MLRLVVGLKTLAHCRDDLREAALRLIDDAVERGLAALTTESDKTALRQAVKEN